MALGKAIDLAGLRVASTVACISPTLSHEDPIHCPRSTVTSPSLRAQEASPEEIRAIAREAYIYAYPIVDSYRIQHAYFIDRTNPEFKAPYNVFHNIARVFTPEDKAVQTPNSDTPYSFIGLDLRAEPFVLTVPAIAKGRYFSVQFVDAYTHNFAYLGSRTTGNGGGNYLIAGPNWKGEKPAGVQELIRTETELLFALFRTQLFLPRRSRRSEEDPGDLQGRAALRLPRESAPPAAPAIDFPKPLTPEEQKSSLESSTCSISSSNSAPPTRARPA